MKTFLMVIMGVGWIHAGLAATQTLQVDAAESHIEVAVHATVDSFTAHLKTFEAQITFDPDNQHFEGAEIRFAFLDLQTGKKDRDRQMHEWQHTAAFPAARFELTRLDPVAEGRRMAHGTLHLHGVALPVSFPVLLRFDPDRLSIDGAATVDTRDLGLPVIRKMKVLKVNPHVTVRFHVQGTLAPTTTVAAK